MSKRKTGRTQVTFDFDTKADGGPPSKKKDPVGKHVTLHDLIGGLGGGSSTAPKSTDLPRPQARVSAHQQPAFMSNPLTHVLTPAAVLHAVQAAAKVLSYDPDWPSARNRTDIQRIRLYECAATTIVYNLLQHVGDNEEIEWPSTTSIACWWCRANFSTIPIKIPSSIDNRREKQFRQARGIFCSWNCAMAFLVEQRGPIGPRSEALCFLRSRVLNTRPTPINPAPPWQALASFGGHMTLEEFRSTCEPLCQETGGSRLNKRCLLLNDLVDVAYDRVLISRGDGQIDSASGAMATGIERALPKIGTLGR